MLSWGPPHAPYETAPERYRAPYDPEALTLRENVPGEMAAEVRPWTAGYYAHCTALDDCVGQLLALLDETGLADETILLFTSDHGDLLGSHGYMKKQQPWEESIRVPFLLRVPGLEGWTPRTLESPIDAPDILPTLCGLAGVERPGSVEGLDFSGAVRTGEEPEDAAALLSCMQPFGQWDRVRFDGREYRGLRTRRYTYAEDRSGPWLLFDNEADPFQLENLVGEPAHAALRDDLAARLHKRLDALGDAFEPGEAYLERWGYEVDEFGTVPYEN
jgi:arylsulfatase A-like enzyme